MSLQIIDGRLLVRNSTDGLWYYLCSYTIGADQFIQVFQTSTLPLGTPSEFAIIEASNGVFYKLYAETNNNNVIHYSIDTLVGTQIADDFRIVDSVTGRYYKITITIVNGVGHVGLVNTGSDICVPWRLFSVSSAESRRSFTPVTSVTPRTHAVVIAESRRSFSAVDVDCERDVVLP